MIIINIIVITIVTINSGAILPCSFIHKCELLHDVDQLLTIDLTTRLLTCVPFFKDIDLFVEDFDEEVDATGEMDVSWV